VGDVRGLGLLGGVELVKDRESKEPFDPSLGAGRRVWLAALEQGVIVRAIAGDVIAISPPFVISEEQIDRIVEALGQAVDRIGKELNGRL